MSFDNNWSDQKKKKLLIWSLSTFQLIFSDLFVGGEAEDRSFIKKTLKQTRPWHKKFKNETDYFLVSVKIGLLKNKKIIKGIFCYLQNKANWNFYFNGNK